VEIFRLIQRLILLSLLLLMQYPIDAQASPCLTVRIAVNSLEEGETIGYVVGLSEPPAPGEIITISVRVNTDAITLEPSTREITLDTWEAGRVFSVTAAENRIDEEGDQQIVRLSHTTTSDLPGSAFDSITECQPVQIGIIDDDGAIPGTPTPTRPPIIWTPTPDLLPPTPDLPIAPTLRPGQVGIMFDPPLVVLREGDEPAFVRINTNTPPNRRESVTIFPLYDPLQVVISPSIRDVVFSSWDEPRIFEIRVIDDTIMEADQVLPVRLYVTSTDPYSPYFNLTAAPTLIIQVLDNDR